VNVATKCQMYENKTARRLHVNFSPLNQHQYVAHISPAKIFKPRWILAKT